VAVNEATSWRFDLVDGLYVVFSSPPDAAGRKAVRPGGRLRWTPFHRSSELVDARFYAGLIRFEGVVCQGGWENLAGFDPPGSIR
jgi:hypothetical protein